MFRRECLCKMGNVLGVQVSTVIGLLLSQSAQFSTTPRSRRSNGWTDAPFIKRLKRADTPCATDELGSEGQPVFRPPGAGLQMTRIGQQTLIGLHDTLW